MRSKQGCRLKCKMSENSGADLAIAQDIMYNSRSILKNSAESAGDRKITLYYNKLLFCCQPFCPALRKKIDGIHA